MSRVRKLTGNSVSAFSRRTLLASLPGVWLARSALAQSSGIRLLKLNCFEIRVTDPEASLKFYQGLFGMPVQARQGDRMCLRVGDGPQFMAMRPLLSGETPAITQIGYSVENFDIARVQSALTSVGFEQTAAPRPDSTGEILRMKTWVSERNGTRELFFADLSGLVVQLSSADYCGGSGELGTQCQIAEPAPAGLLALTELNHFTVFGADGAANEFYQQTFDLSVQAYQGPGSPVTGIGDGHQFVMYAGGGGRRGGPAQPSINHGSFNMKNFDVDRVLQTLTDYGLSDRGDRQTGPLMHYISLRMPNRGGAEGGTPELYFTDPDGILLQLQDVTYCGGGGYLGSECLAG